MTACPGLTGRACLRFPAARPRTDCAATFRSCEAVSNVSDQSGASACRSASRHHATSPRGPLAGVNGHAKVVRRRFFLIVDLLRAQQRRRVSRRRGRMCQFGSFGLASRREPAEVPRRSAAARAARVSMEASWGPSFNRGTRRSTLAPEGISSGARLLISSKGAAHLSHRCRGPVGASLRFGSGPILFERQSDESSRVRGR